MRPDLGGADLHGAQLLGVNFEQVDLHGADLRDASLNEANFRGTHLQGTKLEGAILEKVTFSGANLQGTDFSDTTGLTQEHVDSATTDEHTLLPDHLLHLSDKAEI